MQQMVTNTMKNPRAPAYRRLMDACLDRPVSYDRDVSYDSDLPRPSTRTLAATEQVLTFSFELYRVGFCHNREKKQCKRYVQSAKTLNKLHY